ncbi:MAG: hypothetical protein ACRD3H_17225, partial [Terriglobales bacterium]
EKSRAFLTLSLRIYPACSRTWKSCTLTYTHIPNSHFKRPARQGISWLDDFLYLPEVLYVLFFIWLICSGPGRFSVDYWIAGKLLV